MENKTENMTRRKVTGEKVTVEKEWGQWDREKCMIQAER